MCWRGAFARADVVHSDVVLFVFCPAVFIVARRAWVRFTFLHIYHHAVSLCIFVRARVFDPQVCDRVSLDSPPAFLAVCGRVLPVPRSTVHLPHLLVAGKHRYDGW